MAGLLAFFTTLNPKVDNPARAPDTIKYCIWEQAARAL